jgi:hypothetical protein
MRFPRLCPAVAVLAAAGCSVDELRTGPGLLEPGVDLAADPPVAPAAAAVGSVLEYELRLHNRGTERAGEGWYVRVYLSEDAVLGPGDMLVDQFVARRAVNPGAADSYARGFKIPASVPPGTYHLISELDATGLIAEPVEDNNTAASPGRTRITAPDPGV